MIAKRILRTSGQDNARALGQYIADASHEGEKCLLSWHEGCLAPDYDLALAEIEATQAMNTRCQRDKTYHLMVSFRPEDEAKLTPEAFQDIEQTMAEALGLSEHQRVCGVHKNTNNLHLHVAYNLIRPDQFTINEPYYDFFKLSKACRVMEEKFGLEIDNGVEVVKGKKVNQRAAAMEAHSGEQSFQSFVLDRRDQILTEVTKAASWQEAHQILSGYGIGIKEQGNGLALVNLQGKETMKASALDRSLSKGKLVARFGKYVKPEPGQPTQETYTRKPIQPRSPERDQLYKNYQAAIQEKIAKVDAEKEYGQAEVTKIYAQWDKAKEILRKETFSRRSLATRLDLLRMRQMEALTQARLEHRERLTAVKAEYPWHNWNGYLKHQAEQYGNKTALEVLRSRPESAPAKTSLDLDTYLLEQAQEKLKAAKREKEMVQGSLNAGRRKAMTAVNRMNLLAIQEQLRIKAGIEQSPMFAGYRQAIDNRGVVIFTLADGGTIRDTGKKLHFSPDGATREAAMRYALAKFGKALAVKSNTIERKRDGRGAEGSKPHPGILRESARYGLRTLSKLPLAFGRKGSEMFLPGHAHADLER